MATTLSNVHPMMFRLLCCLPVIESVIKPNANEDATMKAKDGVEELSAFLNSTRVAPNQHSSTECANGDS